MRRGERPPQDLSYHGRREDATLPTQFFLGALEDEKSGNFTVAEGKKVLLTVDRDGDNATHRGFSVEIISSTFSKF